MSIQLPQKLQRLVSWSIALLGQAIKEELGQKTFNEIEKIRREMKSIRESGRPRSSRVLSQTYKRLEKNSDDQLYVVAHSYAVMLELINACEISYRTYRVLERGEVVFTKRPYGITYVLTAHPTEARSTETLALFSSIQQLLLEALQNQEEAVEKKLFHLLKLALLVPMSRRESPSVKDEAQNIYSKVLRSSILNELVELKRQDVPVYFRAWVGGDKDGHPGVNEVTMLQSLELSRGMILDHVLVRLDSIHHRLSLVESQKGAISTMIVRIEVLISNARGLRQIKEGDGEKIKKFKKALLDLKLKYQKRFGLVDESLDHLAHLIWIFPALVVPLELREDSELVRQALTKKNMVITKMLQGLKKISQGYEPRWYVRGFVLSMVMSSADLVAGLQLMKRELGKSLIPVVPLFENEHALVHACEILEETFNSQSRLVERHQKNYAGRFEVMLGYSDSSKENGVFTSRYLISKALKDVDRLFKSYQLTPVFFHGSGGSVERGGGSVREQTQWWPESAVNIFKATIQGEMVARTFANPHLMRRQVEIISSQLIEPRSSRTSKATQLSLKDFSDRVRRYYSVKVKDPDFLKMVEKATPYMFLQHLKIGSRPAKRAQGLGPTSLRAIPWILCWTQTRTLFPTWWGVGSSFQELPDEQKWRLKEAYNESSLLRSFVKVLAFTLAKVELPVWEFYLNQSGLDRESVEKLMSEFEQEYHLAVNFVQSMSGEEQLLWYRPWLAQSIRYRSTMIHPLNLIQILALKRHNLSLLRETVTGIACGMMTTG
jgi:phosphoenolpyruvate carboxylase